MKITSLYLCVLALPCLTLGLAHAQAESPNQENVETAAILNAITEGGADSGSAAEAFSLPSNTGDEIVDSNSSGDSEGETETIDGEEVYVLGDFEVSVEKDEGYYSAHSLAGTRTSQLVKNTPMTISVINEQLIADLDIQDIGDLTQVMSNASSDPEEGLIFRGFKSSRNLVEFMPRVIARNGYNTGRVDVIRGVWM